MSDAPAAAAEGQRRPPSSYWESSRLNNKNRDRRERAAASVSIWRKGSA
jgi:hypothetical protein